MSSQPEPTHLLAHLSDTHFLADQALLYGSVDTDATLRTALEQLEGSTAHIDALVFTGDIADLGEADAYARIRALVEPAAERMNAQLIWVMGNHDDRGRMRTDLLGEAEGDEPVDRVFDLNGLRVIALDSSVPGFHHGELTPSQLEWLASELARPAAHGTVLALHHPPIPTSLPMMPILELQDQPAFADVIRGTDVRAILGGHLHYSTHSLFAGIPISVGAATCYTMDLNAPANELTGVDGGQSFDLVHVYPEQVVHSTIPIGRFPLATRIPPEMVERVQALTPAEQREAFSRQRGN